MEQGLQTYAVNNKQVQSKAVDHMDYRNSVYSSILYEVPLVE